MAWNPNTFLIVVVGGKGGVGKSTLAANLACAFLKELRQPTLLVDLDSNSCGDQNIIMGLKPKMTASQLCQYKGAFLANSLPNVVAKHSCGLSYIGAVQGPGESLQANSKVFVNQLNKLSAMFRYIIVDAGGELGDLQASVLDLADSCLVVTTAEVLAINRTGRIFQEIGKTALPGELVHLLVNQYDKRYLDPSSVGKRLGHPVIGVFPKDDVSTYASLQANTPFVLNQANIPLTQSYHALVRKLTGGLLQQSKKLQRNESAGQGEPADKVSVNREQGHKHLKLQIHTELIQSMDLKKDLTNTSGNPAKEEQLRKKTQSSITQIIDRIYTGLSRDRRSQIIKEVLDEALGLGPLEALLADSRVTEIMVNGADKIYAEIRGKVQLSPVTFTSNQHVRNIIERIVTPLGRRIDEKNPYVDARLADGSRVNAVIEPLSIDGPSITIRKFPEERITIEDYYERFGSLTASMASFLKLCVEQGLNIIISGGTGSGKTTLLNALSGFIPEKERIITVEDAAELQLKQEHVVRLETRPANMEGEGEVSIRDLVRNCLRMRPDRIIVGECRDGAALDMLAAMNTGHDGSMTTVHANNPREAVSRLETLAMMAGMDLPIRAIREQIAGAVDLIVQIGRLSDGSRKVKSITEVIGIQGDTVTLQEIFRFKEGGFDKDRKIIGKFQAMGLIPTFVEEFEKKGIHIPRDLFTTAPEGESPSVPKAPKPQRPKIPNYKPQWKKASGEDQ